MSPDIEQQLNAIGGPISWTVRTYLECQDVELALAYLKGAQDQAEDFQAKTQLRLLAKLKDTIEDVFKGPHKESLSRYSHPAT